MTVVFEEIKRNMAALNSEFSLIYFPLLAKGFGVALVAEFSGLPYDGQNFEVDEQNGLESTEAHYHLWSTAVVKNQRWYSN